LVGVANIELGTFGLKSVASHKSSVANTKPDIKKKTLKDSENVTFSEFLAHVRVHHT
jgi:hypothetical protein